MWEKVCPLEECKCRMKRKVHSLVKKVKPLCIHTILAIQASEYVKPDSKVRHNIDFEKTVKKVMIKIRSKFPVNFRMCEEGSFAIASKCYVDSLMLSINMEETLAAAAPKFCEDCNQELKIWKFKEPNSYCVTLGKMKETHIPVLYCSKCMCAYYPELYENGLVFLHNSLMVSFDLLLDMINALRLGVGLTMFIQHRLELLANCSTEVKLEDLDVHNLSIKLEQFTIAFACDKKF